MADQRLVAGIFQRARRQSVAANPRSADAEWSAHRQRRPHFSNYRKLAYHRYRFSVVIRSGTQGTSKTVRIPEAAIWYRQACTAAIRFPTHFQAQRVPLQDDPYTLGQTRRQEVAFHIAVLDAPAEISAILPSTEGLGNRGQRRRRRHDALRRTVHFPAGCWPRHGGASRHIPVGGLRRMYLERRPFSQVPRTGRIPRRPPGVIQRRREGNSSAVRSARARSFSSTGPVRGHVSGIASKT